MPLQEHQLSDEIRKQAGANPRILLRRRNVGRYLAVSGQLQDAVSVLRACGISARPVVVGDAGEADLQGLIADWPCQHCGRAAHPMPLAVEVKSDSGRLSELQTNWRDNAWLRRGGLYVLAAPRAGLTLAQSAAQIIREFIR